MINKVPMTPKMMQVLKYFKKYYTKHEMSPTRRKMQVDLGEERPRQILAGIKEYYTAEELVGTQVCVVANLKPAKLMGMISEGMLMAAKDENGLCLIRPEKTRTIGTKIS